MNQERAPRPDQNQELSPDKKRENKKVEKSPEVFLVTSVEHKRTIEEQERIDELEEKLKKKKETHTSYEHFTEEDHKDIDELLGLYEKAAAKKEEIRRIATNITDFLPIVGSLKMAIEGIMGEQFGTKKKLEGGVRIVHGASGVVFLILDVTAVGAIASEFGKLGIKVGIRMLEKETIKKIFENKVVRKKGTEFLVRGKEKINQKEKIADA